MESSSGVCLALFSLPYIRSMSSSAQSLVYVDHAKPLPTACYVAGPFFIDATPPYYLLHMSWPILCHLEADDLKFLTSNLSPPFVTPS